MIGSYMVDALTIVRHAARDQWNEEGTPTLELTTGYIEWGTKLIRDLQGDQVVAAGRVWLEYDSTLTHEDKLRIDSVDHVILKIETQKDFEARATLVYIA